MKYSSLSDGVKTYDEWYKQYFIIFLIRRILFVSMAYYLSDDKFTVLQVFLNLLLTQLFVSYLINVRPFEGQFENNIEISNEIWLLFLSYHQISFTDICLFPETKITMGYSMIVFSALNMFCNFVVMLKVSYTMTKLQIIKEYRI